MFAQVAELLTKTCIITTHFNYAGYKTNTENYSRWLENLPPIVPVYAAEAYINEPDLPQNDSAHHINFQLPDDSFYLWQKEPLVNMVVAQLPENIEYIIWSDHDCLFSHPYWLEQTVIRLATDCDVVQCYSDITYLDKKDKPTKTYPSMCRAYKHKIQATHSGTPGLVWGARRKFYEAIGGLTPYNIVGGGDRSFAEAVLGITTDSYDKFLSPNILTFNREVRRGIRRHLRNSVDFIPVVASHLYHGAMNNRQYRTRYNALTEEKFQPLRDVSLNDFGVIPTHESNLVVGLPYLNNASENLKRAMKDYFIGRKED